MDTPTPMTLRGWPRRWVWGKSKVIASGEQVDTAADAWQLLIDAVNDNSGTCSAKCNSFGHAEDCKYVDMASSLSIQQDKIVDLRTRLEAAEYVRQHSRLLFVAKRVLVGALDNCDLRIAVDEHEALVAVLAGEKP